MEGVCIEPRPGLGNALVATKDYHPGDLVVAEQPLLHVPQMRPSNPMYKPLQNYFESHGIPASVVLKLLAFLTAEPETQSKVLQCGSPDPTTFAGATVVQQAQLFAQLLLAHPALPEFDRLMQQQQQQQQELSAHDLLVKLWLIWVTNGHNFTSNRSPGSALFEFGSKLTHTCSGPNTAYRTASGDTASVHALAAAANGSSSGSKLLPAAVNNPLTSGAAGQDSRAAAATATSAAEAGYHVAIAEIASGNVLTTNYLGLGHKRLLSTPMRQKILQDKFLFTCSCHRCCQEVDLARGIPCPLCSEGFRAPDKLLEANLALPELDVLLLQQQHQQQQHQQQRQQQQPEQQHGDAASGSSAELMTCSAAKQVEAAASNSGPSSTAGDCNISSSGSNENGSSGGSTKCGFLYCDMRQLLAGGAAPWRCDLCSSHFANDTAELWGRYYARSHSHIESDMEGWVMRFDDSLDQAPLIREPSALHDKILGIVRLLGPRHWASWRLLLLGVELHCGVLEQAVVQHSVKQQSKVADTSSRLCTWVLRYCYQLWQQVSHCYGQVEAGQVLGYHFSEAAQVLLQAASCPGLLASEEANGVTEQALQLQQLVLAGLRSLMGPSYHPLAQLLAAAAVDTANVIDGVALADEKARLSLGSDVSQPPGATSGPKTAASGKLLAADVRRHLQQQAAEAHRMQQLMAELKALEAQEGP